MWVGLGRGLWKWTHGQLWSRERSYRRRSMMQMQWMWICQHWYGWWSTRNISKRRYIVHGTWSPWLTDKLLRFYISLYMLPTANCHETVTDHRLRDKLYRKENIFTRIHFPLIRRPDTRGEQIAWKLVNFCNIICWTQSLTFCLKISSRCGAT